MGKERGTEIMDAPARPSDTGVDTGTRTGLEKPQDMKDKEKEQGELRKLGKTASSADLPSIDFSDNPNAVTEANPGKLSTDAKGNVSRIEYPNGDSSTITYDGSNNPTQIRNKDGSSLRKEGDGWTSYDAHGKKLEHKAGELTVGKDGTTTFTGPDGFKDIERADGSGRTAYPDKSVVDRDVKGHPTTITRPDGSKTEILYDAEGKPKEIHDQGYTWKRDGDQWNVTNDVDGSFYDRKTNVSVRSDGYIISDSKSGAGQPATEAIRPDGKTETTYDMGNGHTSTNRPDGSSIDRRPDGSSTEWIPEGGGFRQKVTDKNGKTFEIPPPTEEEKRMAWHFDGPQRDDGTQYFQNDNGDRLTLYKNGDGVIHHKNGRREEFHGKKK